MTFRNILQAMCAALVVAGTAVAQAAPSKAPQRQPAVESAAQAKPGAKQSVPAWASQCVSNARSAAPDCSVAQRVLLKQNGQLLAVVTVSLPHDAHAPTILIQAPLGLALTKGMTLKIDNRGPVTLPLQTCDQSGCYAATKMSDDFLAGMRTGKTLELQFYSNNKNLIKVPLPLDGFAAAYARIK